MMNVYFPGFRFRRTAPIAPPVPDHQIKHKISALYHEASVQRRIALGAETQYRDAVEAREKGNKLIRDITVLAGSSSDAYRAARISFYDRHATTNAGQNILFLDPDCALQDPHVAPPAGVNHPGRRAQFTWAEDAVAQLVRILAHTEARIVLTSKWRNRATMRTSFNKELQKRGLPPLLGRTQVLEGDRAKNGGPVRAAEVLEFLDAYVAGGAPAGAAVHGWCCLDESNCVQHAAARFEGHFVRTDPRQGISPIVADQCIERLRMKRLDAPSRAWVVKPFNAAASGLRFRATEDLRPGKNPIYGEDESDDSDDSDDDDDDDSGDSTNASVTTAET